MVKIRKPRLTLRELKSQKVITESYNAVKTLTLPLPKALLQTDPHLNRKVLRELNGLSNMR